MVNIAVSKKTIKGMFIVTKKETLIDKYFSECDTMKEKDGIAFLKEALTGSIWDSKDEAYTCKLICANGVKVGIRLMRYGKVDPMEVEEVLDAIRANVRVEELND